MEERKLKKRKSKMFEKGRNEIQNKRRESK